jgi:hypothetical protein
LLERFGSTTEWVNWDNLTPEIDSKPEAPGYETGFFPEINRNFESIHYEMFSNDFPRESPPVHVSRYCMMRLLKDNFIIH